MIIYIFSFSSLFFKLKAFNFFWTMSSLIGLFCFSWNFSFFIFSQKTITMMVFLNVFILMMGYFSKQNMSTFLNSTIFFCSLFFCSSNLLLLFFFFECSLIPVLLIILMWGVQPERFSAFYFLLIYTIFSSFPLFMGILSLHSLSLPFFWCISTFSIFAFSMGFLVKLPLFLFHIWLPKAHVEAPTLGSIILAGLMLKLGGFGLIILMSIFLSKLKTIFLIVSFFGSLICCFICCFQSDSKSLIAFSSICHLNFLFFIFIMFTEWGKVMSYFTMLIHGINSSFMFWLAGQAFHCNFSRNIFWLSLMSVFSLSLIMSSLIIFSSNFGVPPLISSFQEILFFGSMISFSWKFWFIGMFYIFLVCYFSLFFLTNMFLGGSSSACFFSLEIFGLGICLFMFDILLLQLI